jgi:hypothetical protein
MNLNGAAQMTLVLGGFLGEDVALEGLATLDGSAGANPKALGSAFLGLHLGHDAAPMVLPRGGDALTLALEEPGQRNS